MLGLPEPKKANRNQNSNARLTGTQEANRNQNGNAGTTGTQKVKARPTGTQIPESQLRHRRIPKAQLLRIPKAKTNTNKPGKNNFP